MSHSKGWLLLILGVLAAGLLWASLDFRHDTVTAAPLAQATATNTPTVTSTPTSTATPGAAAVQLGGVPIYAPHAPAGNNLLGVSCETGCAASGTPVPQFTQLPYATAAPSLTPYSVGSGAVQPIQPNGAPAAQTPIAVATPIVQVNGTVVVAQTTPLPISGGAAAVSLTTPIPAGEAFIGKVGGSTLHPSANPVLTVAATYVSGDYVGTSTTPWSWTACRTSGGSFQVQSMTVVDKAAQSIAGEVWLFDRSITVPADSAAWTVTDADAQFLIGVIPTGTYYASAANSVSVTTGVGMTGWCNSGTTISGAYVTRGSPSYASGDLTVILGLVTD